MKTKLTCIAFAALILCAPCLADGYVPDPGVGEEDVRAVMPEGADSLPSPTDPGFFTRLWKLVTSDLGERIARGAAMLASVISVTAVGALLKTVSASVPDRRSKVFDWLVCLCAAWTALGPLRELFALARDRLEALCGFMNAVTPVTGALWALGGDVRTGLAQSAGVTLMTSVFSWVNSRLLEPLAGGLAALCAAASLSDLTPGISAAIKKLFVTALGFMMTVFTFILGVQTQLSKSADTLAMRSVRFAFSGFVPVVGSLVGESARSVSAAVNAVRASAGTLIAASVVTVVAAPLIAAAIFKLCLRLGAFFASLCSLKELSTLFGGLNDACGLVLALLLSSGVYFIISAAFLIFSGAALGGVS